LQPVLPFAEVLYTN